MSLRPPRDPHEHTGRSAADEPGFGCLRWHRLVRICHLTLRLSQLLIIPHSRTDTRGVDVNMR